MVTKKIIKGISNSKGSKETTKKSNAKGHDQYNQKHGTKGKSKGKGNEYMEDNEVKASQKKDRKGWSEIQQGEPLTKLANIVVLDRMEEPERGTEHVACAWQLKVDRDASFVTVT